MSAWRRSQQSAPNSRNLIPREVLCLFMILCSRQKFLRLPHMPHHRGNSSQQKLGESRNILMQDLKRPQNLSTGSCTTKILDSLRVHSKNTWTNAPVVNKILPTWPSSATISTKCSRGTSILIVSSQTCDYR